MIIRLKISCNFIENLVMAMTFRVPMILESMYDITPKGIIELCNKIEIEKYFFTNNYHFFPKHEYRFLSKRESAIIVQIMFRQIKISNQRDELPYSNDHHSRNIALSST